MSLFQPPFKMILKSVKRHFKQILKIVIYLYKFDMYNAYIIKLPVLVI